MWELVANLVTEYGLPVALAIVGMGAEGFAIFKLWQRNQMLYEKLVEAGQSSDEDAPLATGGEVEEAVAELREALDDSMVVVVKAIETLRDGDDGREMTRMDEDLQRLRDELARERAALTSLHEKRFQDVRALHSEQIETMRAATQAIERLGALLEGAMRRDER